MGVVEGADEEVGSGVGAHERGGVEGARVAHRPGRANTPGGERGKGDGARAAADRGSGGDGAQDKERRWAQERGEAQEDPRSEGVAGARGGMRGEGEGDDEERGGEGLAHGGARPEREARVEGGGEGGAEGCPWVVRAGGDSDDGGGGSEAGDEVDGDDGGEGREAEAKREREGKGIPDWVKCGRAAGGEVGVSEAGGESGGVLVVEESVPVGEGGEKGGRGEAGGGGGDEAERERAEQGGAGRRGAVTDEERPRAGGTSPSGSPGSGKGTPRRPR